MARNCLISLKWLSLGLFLLIAGWNSELIVRAEGPPVWIICTGGCPFSQIQQVIDIAKPGDLLLVGPGTYRENLTINKSLTLQGVTRELTRIEGATPGKPVIHIESEEEIAVSLENFTFANATRAEGSLLAVGCADWPLCPDGIQVLGEVKVAIKNTQIASNAHNGLIAQGEAQVVLSNSEISSNRWNGLEVLGLPQVTLYNSTVFENGIDGVHVENYVVGSAQVSLNNSHISKNRDDGLDIRGSGRVQLSNSSVFENRVHGLRLLDSAEVSLSNSLVSSNGGFGLRVAHSVQVNLSNSEVSNNSYDGLSVVGEAQVSVSSSEISSNGFVGVTVGGTGFATVKIQDSTISGNSLAGILLWGRGISEIRRNSIMNNGYYGVALYLTECIANYDIEKNFNGQVTGSDNTIPDKDEPDGNKLDDVCPSWLSFLKQP